MQVRLNYKENGDITSEVFPSCAAAYDFAVKNIATHDDREYYMELCGETFEGVVKGVDDVEPLMLSIMRNAMVNIVYVDWKD